MIKLTPKENEINDKVKIHNLGMHKKPSSPFPHFIQQAHFLTTTRNNFQGAVLPVQIIKYHIGFPFQIRIPSSEMAYLEKQVKNLREKCEILQRQTFQTKPAEELESTFLEVSNSTKNIELQLEKMISYESTTIQASSRMATTEYSQYNAILEDLKNCSSKIAELEDKNEQLSRHIEWLESQNSQIESQNQEMRKKIPQNRRI